MIKKTISNLDKKNPKKKQTKNKIIQKKENKIPNIKIIFENQNVLVIDKPINIMSHGDDRKDEYTLADFFKDYSKKKFKKNILKEVGEEGREGVVHRLDTDTTGVMIFAFNKDSFNFLKRQFQAHTIKKIYHAIVIGNVKHDTGIIDSSISRSKSDFRKKNTLDMFSKDVRGKEREAITRYKVLKRFTKNNRSYSLVECYPETGRTHQIRVHLKSIRHPILGDALYGVGEIERKKIEEDFKIKIQRPMLHAYSLLIKIVNDDKSTEEKLFQVKEHKDMLDILNILENNK